MYPGFEELIMQAADLRHGVSMVLRTCVTEIGAAGGGYRR